MTTEKATELSIVLPCLNEAETLATCIAKAQSFLRDHDIVGEIIVADNGSADGSQEIARDAGVRVVEVTQPGYGSAAYGGTVAAVGKYVIMADADDSYDLAGLSPFLDELRGGADLVMGNRGAGGIGRGAMPWKNRFIGNPLLSGIGRLLFRCPVKDMHCGIRGFSRAAFERMDLRTTGMEYASEMVIKATLLGMDIREVPTTLRPAGRSREPHLRPFRDGWRHLRFMLLGSPKWLFLYPGLLLAAFGLIFGGWLMVTPIHIGGAELDVHSLAYAAVMVCLGYQLVSLAVMLRVRAVHMGLKQPSRVLARLGSVFRPHWLGAALLVAGLAGTVAALRVWQGSQFGPLEARSMMRIVIPSVVAMILGGQTIMTGLFMSTWLEGDGRRR